MECPKCKYVRQAKDSIVPDWQCPSCGVVYAKVKAACDKKVAICLTSGKVLLVDQIKLYDLKLVQQFEAMKAAAAKNLSGFSTGLGFWGDFEWVAIGSLVTGAVEGAVSSAMRDQGIGQLSEVASIARQIRETAVFAKISEIINIKYPDPSLWSCSKLANQKKYNLVHIASNYVFVESDGKETSIFWDKVEQYELA